MKQEELKKPIIPTSKYIAATGKRKNAIAQVRLWPKEEGNEIIVNGKKLSEYFIIFELQKIINEPLKLVNKNSDQKFYFTIKVHGGGLRGQADAARLGIARVLVKSDEDLRVMLKRAGFLTRDARVKERKKPGLKGARRAPQWAKR